MNSNKQLNELSEIDKSLQNAQGHQERFLVLMQFEEYFNSHNEASIEHLLLFWPLALELGKINLASKYAQSAMNRLIEFKRVPMIKELIKKIKEKGLLKNKWHEYEGMLEILEGKNINLSSDALKRMDILSDHPELWKNNAEFLKQYLLLEAQWDYDQWKLCYEYVLKNYFDREIFLSLYEKSKALNYLSHVNNFEKYFLNQNIKTPRSIKEQKSKVVVKEASVKLDYDQIAFNMLSGKSNPTEDEQVRVINSLKYIEDQELLSKGSDMVVAFELLGMEKVVVSLCEKLVPLTDDVGKKASLYFMWAQSLFNNEDYFKCLDIIDLALEKEPLINDELLALIYLKAESCVKVNNKKMAKELFLQIKKQNPNYRMVKERLREIG